MKRAVGQSVFILHQRIFKLCIFHSRVAFVRVLETVVGKQCDVYIFGEYLNSSFNIYETGNSYIKPAAKKNTLYSDTKY